MGDLLTSKVLRHIRGYYREAVEQLPEEEVPSLLSAGACFGLLDPVSNIIVNTAIASKDSTPSIGEKENRKRKRSQQIGEEVERDKEKVLTEAARSIAKRSLDGLLTFLVCYFPYLHTREALRYLRLAKADLLVAARLIDLDRCVATSATAAVNPSKTSVQVALKCAAISSKHPCPATLTGIWLSLATSSPPDQQRQLHELSSHPRLQALLLALPLTMGFGHLHTPRQHKALRLYHKQRSRDRQKKAVHPGLTEYRIHRLHDMIHRVYLNAIARLPREPLCLRHHRGLLKAGYCFGPMDDPVSNILLNTIWYDTVFPPEEEFMADMLCTKSLMRVQTRSEAGLINFLCTRFPDLSQHDAVMFLLEADANLHEAVSRAQREGHDPSGSLEEAYREASLAAWHPDPELLVKFAVSTMPSSVLSCLRVSDCTLSAEDVEAISASLEAPLGSPSSQSSRMIPEKLSPLALDMVTRYQEIFEDDRYFFRRYAEAALQEFAEKSKGPEYRLHVICGVNTAVAERDYTHLYCHINFRARPRGLPSAAETAPKLFFVECSYDDEDTEVVRCCVVDPSTDSGRCFYCEMRGTKIVHPSFGRYRGCDTNFEEMVACREGLTVANEELISYGTHRAEFLGWLKGKDDVYFDPRWDFKLAEVLNKAYEKKKDLHPLYTEPIR